MARIRRAKEMRQQSYWASLIKGSAPSNFAPRTPTDLTSGVRLFENKPNGGISVTNMEGAGGSFPTRQVYRILTMRVWLMFFGCIDTATGASPIDLYLYHQALSQLDGDVGTSTDVLVNNGQPTTRAIAQLARSIALSAGQDFYVKASVEANGTSNFATTLGTLDSGELVVTFFIDGIHVRDIL
jgi:hypothetical protein